MKLAKIIIMLALCAQAFSAPPANVRCSIYDGVPPVVVVVPPAPPPPTAQEIFSARLGPTFEQLNPGAVDDRPDVYMAPGRTIAQYDLDHGISWRVSPWQVGVQPGPDNDFWSDSGTVLYQPDDVSLSGTARTQTYAYYNHVHNVAPRVESLPEPHSTQYYEAGVNMPLKSPVAMANGITVMTTNERVVVYSNGVIGTAGSQTSREGNVPFDYPVPTAKLPADFVPTDIALTTSNEFAFVTGHNTTTGKGQLAVIACEGHCIQFHTWQWIGFPNQGSWSDFKIMGYIDLPGLDYPTSVATASNGLWMGTSATNNKTLGQIDITDQGTRWGLRQHPDMGWVGIVATAGYAVVASKTENKAVFIDLKPLLGWIKAQYLDDDKQPATLAKFNWVTMNAGGSVRPVPRATAAFPGLLTAENSPVIVKTFDVTGPTAVLAGQRIERWSPDIHKAYVAEASGVLRIFDTSSLFNRYDFERGGSLRDIGSVAVGANPVRMCFARFQQAGTPLIPAGSFADPQNNLILIACRGSRSIDCVVTMDGRAQVYQRISDKRLQDPVDVSVGDRGNIITVCDYNGGQIINYRVGGLRDHVTNGAWGQLGTMWLPGPAGQPLPYECGGVQKLSGKPFRALSNNLN